MGAINGILMGVYAVVFGQVTLNNKNRMNTPCEIGVQTVK